MRMRARDAAGNIAKEQVLQFTIRPPWWRTLPALLGGALLLTGLLALLALDYRRRLNRNHALAMAEHMPVATAMRFASAAGALRARDGATPDRAMVDALLR